MSQGGSIQLGTGGGGRRGGREEGRRGGGEAGKRERLAAGRPGRCAAAPSGRGALRRRAARQRAQTGNGPGPGVAPPLCLWASLDRRPALPLGPGPKRRGGGALAPRGLLLESRATRRGASPCLWRPPLAVPRPSEITRPGGGNTVTVGSAARAARGAEVHRERAQPRDSGRRAFRLASAPAASCFARHAFPRARHSGNAALIGGSVRRCHGGGRTPRWRAGRRRFQ